MSKTAGIIQARMGSSRLPGKVLKEIAGKPMLQHMVERTRKVQQIDQVIIATTEAPLDDPIEAFCEEFGCSIYRGSVHDVLDRYYQTAQKFQVENIVRLTADCPLLDPLVVAKTISAFLDRKVDFAANRLPPPFKRTYPIGLDTEVCSFKALEQAWREAKEKFEREHVMPYLYRVEGRFKTLVIDYEIDYGSWRLTVDTPEDLDLIRKIFDHFGDRPFNWLNVIHYLENHPEIAQINANIQHKTVFDVDHRG